MPDNQSTFPTNVFGTPIEPATREPVIGYRQSRAANNLPATGQGAVADVLLSTKVTGDTFNRLEILADGTLKQGPGSIAPYASPFDGSVPTPMVRQGINLYFRVPAFAQQFAVLQGPNCGYIPIMMPSACTLTEIGVEVTVAGSAGSIIRFGLHADDTVQPGSPGPLITELGTVTAATIGNRMLTVSQPLLPGVLYWILPVSQLNAFTTIAAGSNGAVLPQATINVASTTGYPASGAIYIAGNVAVPIFYTGVTATQFTGCSGGTATLATGQSVQSYPATHPTLLCGTNYGIYGSTTLTSYTGSGPSTGIVLANLPVAPNLIAGPAGSVAMLWLRLQGT